MNLPTAQLHTEKATIALYRDKCIIRSTDTKIIQANPRKQVFPLAGLSAEVITSTTKGRVTATRVATIGAFALATRKGANPVYLTLAGPGVERILEIPRRREMKAREFAAAVNAAVSGSSSSSTP